MQLEQETKACINIAPEQEVAILARELTFCAGMFTIWVVEYIDEGIEILSDLSAGNRDIKGEFLPNTVH